MNKKIKQMLAAGILGGGASYKQNIINAFGSSLVAYYPFNEPSGTPATDIKAGLNGSVTNATVGAAGIGDGRTSYAFTGTGYGTWLAAKNVFNGEEGTFMMWCKVSAAADWTDGAFHVAGRSLVDANNTVSIYKENVNNKLATPYKAGAALLTPALYGVSNTGWFNFGVVWSKSSDIVALLYNGARHDPRTTLGTWAGVPTLMAIASNAATSASVAWKGSLAHMMLFNRALTEVETCNVSRLANIGTKTISILGDSISVNMTIGYQNTVLGTYNGGNNRLINHAVGGQGIMAHMDGQTIAAAADNADIIIVELGTNDADNAAITAEYQENLLELKASNPRAAIYGMGILNKTDETNRAANNARISTACTNAGVTYWDTDGWIVAASDLADGVHPNAGGYAKIATQILARI